VFLERREAEAKHWSTLDHSGLHASKKQTTVPFATLVPRGGSRCVGLWRGGSLLPAGVAGNGHIVDTARNTNHTTSKQASRVVPQWKKTPAGMEHRFRGHWKWAADALDLYSTFWSKQRRCRLDVRDGQPGNESLRLTYMHLTHAGDVRHNRPTCTCFRPREREKGKIGQACLAVQKSILQSMYCCSPPPAQHNKKREADIYTPRR